MPESSNISVSVRGCLADGNRNIRQLKDESGNIVGTCDYTPFGTVIASSCVSVPWQFSSEFTDAETGLVYYTHRYYSPVLGRWLSRDPVAESGGLNLYAMCANDPVNAWDVAGMALWAIDGTGMAESDRTNIYKLYEAYNFNDGNQGVYKKYYRGIGNKIDNYFSPLRMLNQGIAYGARSLRNSCISDICKEYCKNKNIKVDLMGFSRGAAIAKEVAEYLGETGCNCQPVYEYGNRIPIKRREIQHIGGRHLADDVICRMSQE